MRMLLFALTLLGSPDAGPVTAQMLCEYADVDCWRALAQTTIQERDRYRTELRNSQRHAVRYLDRAVRCEYTINSMAETLGFKKPGAK